ncbi:MAG TPA: HAMP domain-containing sensor histidine kinase [Candidatus Binataceae bacterium]|nr:HAMP domain-containing sensor histidine kinase [Candidatus Binataceae bacterium]
MSIRLRLTLYWAAVLTVVLTVACAATALLFERQQWGGLDGALMEEADTAAETIARMGATSADQIVRRLSEERDLGPSRRVWLSRDGHVVADFGSRTADVPAFTSTEPIRGMFDGRRGTFRFAVVPFRMDGAAAFLADGVDATAVRNSVTRLFASLLLIVPLLLVASVAGGYWLAGQALVPINSLAAGLAKIEPHDLSARLELGPARDEIARLTLAINALLDRVERAAGAERRFAADAAHELRTPLTVLRTELEVALSHERTAGEYAQALEAALREAVALCSLADDLLTLARLDQDTSIERAPLDLSAIAREVAEAVEPLAQAKDLIFVTALGNPVYVNGSANHLRRLLINLIDNAVKFAPAHGHVGMALEAQDGQALLLVTDNGPGIPADDLPLVFERFFRSKDRDEPGSGLGLSICREIVRLHGGEISAGNREGGGSEFVVMLPTASAA